jgi:hypothetical protein
MILPVSNKVRCMGHWVWGGGGEDLPWQAQKSSLDPGAFFRIFPVGVSALLAAPETLGYCYDNQE